MNLEGRGRGRSENDDDAAATATHLSQKQKNTHAHRQAAIRKARSEKEASVHYTSTPVAGGGETVVRAFHFPLCVHECARGGRSKGGGGSSGSLTMTFRFRKVPHRPLSTFSGKKKVSSVGILLSRAFLIDRSLVL